MRNTIYAALWLAYLALGLSGCNTTIPTMTDESRESHEKLFWAEYENLNSVSYEAMTKEQRAIIGIANFQGMACSGGIGSQLHNVGLVSLLDSAIALDMIGLNEWAQELRDLVEAIVERGVEDGLTPNSLISDYDLFSRWFFEDEISESFSGRFAKVEKKYFYSDLDFTSKMGHYLANKKQN